MKITQNVLSVLMAMIIMIAAFPVGSLHTVAADKPILRLAAPMASAKSYSVGDIIEFGGYPQSRVTDAATISALDGISKNWISYNYYSGNYSESPYFEGAPWEDGNMRPGDWMRYADIMYNGEKYRAVIFDSYRPYHTGYQTQTSNVITYQKNNGYTVGNIYYFRWEALKWRVLDPSKGLVMSERIIDSQAFHNTVYNDFNNGYTANPECWQDKTQSVYANDYATSSIRSWLIHDFYSSAFSSAEQSLICNTVLDNSAYSSSYPQYNSATTTDKIFLLSYNDMLNASYGFSSSYGTNKTRCAQGTDYAKCQGLNAYKSGDASWLLRSPAGRSEYTTIVNFEGRLADRIFGNAATTTAVGITENGIRPAFQFKSGISESINPTGGSGASAAGTTSSGGIVASVGANNELIISPFRSNAALGALYQGRLTDVTMQWTGGSDSNSETSPQLRAPIDAAKSSGVRLTMNGYRDYVIPPGVIAEWQTPLRANLKLNVCQDVFLEVDDSNGREYVSTVYARESGKGAFQNITVESLPVKKGKTYDFIVSPGRSSGSIRYHLKSESGAVLAESVNGVFTGLDLYDKLDYNEGVYACFTDQNGTSEYKAINLEKQAQKSAAAEAFLKKSEIQLGVGNASYTFPDDAPAIFANAQFDLSVFKFPVYVSNEGEKFRLSFGLNLWDDNLYENEKSIYKTGQTYTHKQKDEEKSFRESLWEDFKGNFKGPHGFGNDIKENKKKWKQFKKRYNKGIKTTAKSLDWTLDFAGYAEGRFNENGDIVITEAELQLGADLHYSHSYQGSVWVIPAYFAFTLGAQGYGKGNCNRVVADASEPLAFELTFGITPEAEIEGGAGFKDAASAGIYLNGRVPITLGFMKNQTQLKVNLQGEFGFRASAFWIFKVNKTLWKGDSEIVNKVWHKNSKSSAPAVPSPGNGEDGLPETAVIVDDRAYLSRTSGWLGETPANSARRIPAQAEQPFTVRTLQSDIFSQASPRLAHLGDRLIMTWVEDDATRDDYNRMRLVYSIYDGENWSAPIPVADDGRNDHAPVIVDDGENAYILWQKLTQTLDENSGQEDLLPCSELYLAEIDGTDGAVAGALRVTENSLYEYAYDLAVNDGVPTVYYTVAENNDMNAGSSTLYRSVNGQSSSVAAELGYVTSIASAFDGGEEKLSFSADTDGNLSTTDDVNVFTCQDGGLIPFEKQTETAYFAPEYVEYDGESVLFASDGQNVYFEKNGTVSPVFADTQSLGVVDYVPADDGIRLIWARSGGEVMTGVYSGEPVEPVLLASAEEDNAIFGSLSFTRFGEAFTGVGLKSVTGEGDTDDRVDLCAFVSNDFSDLSMDPEPVREELIVPGDKIPVRVYLSNRGTTVIDGVDLTTVDSSGMSKTTALAVSLAPGESECVVFSYDVPDSFSSDTLTIFAVPAELTDCNTVDNSGTVTLGIPDVAVAESQLIKTPEGFAVSAYLTECSFAEAKNVKVNLHLNDAENVPVETLMFDKVQKDEIVELHFEIPADELSFENGGANFYVECDCDGEGFKGNNSLNYYVTEHSDPEHGNHQWDNGTLSTAPDCKNFGEMMYTCLICGETDTSSLPKDATNHIGGTQIRNERAATCTKEGYTGDTYCKACGELLEHGAQIPATGHTFGAWKKLNDTQHSRVCANDATHIEKANHTWNAGKVTKAATCTAAGVRNYTCTTCKATKTETIAKLGHSFGAWTKLDETYHQRICANDATHIEKAAHTWDNGNVTTPAAVGKTGVKTYTCTVCKAAKTETIPALPTEPETEPPTKPVTLKPTETKPSITEAPKPTEPTAEPSTTEAPKPTKPTAEPSTTEAPKPTEPTGEPSTTEAPKPTEPTGEVPTTEIPGTTDPTTTDAEPTTAPKPGDEPGTTEKPGETDPAPEKPVLISADDSSLAADHENNTVRLQPNVKAEEFAALTRNEADDLRILTADGAPADAGKPIGTGFVVQLLRSGEVVREYTVIVPLDCTGDGRVNSADARAALRSAARLEPLEGVYFTAADADRNEKVAAADARMILRVAAKLEDYPGMQ